MIANMQEHYCNMTDSSSLAIPYVMEFDSDKEMIEALSDFADMSVSALAKKAGLAVTTLTRIGKPEYSHQLSKPTLQKLKDGWPNFPGFYTPGEMVPDGLRSYLPVKILPSFAGAGGGGSGDGDHETGLVPRHVVEDELRAKPGDMLLIDVRGDSMMPDFHHGDQILVDTRDKNLAQPGSFAIWDGDGYVIKLVERIADNREKLRVFSANNRYTPYDVLVEEIEIMGRPVWFARRL